MLTEPREIESGREMVVVFREKEKNFNSVVVFCYLPPPPGLIGCLSLSLCVSISLSLSVSFLSFSLSLSLSSSVCLSLCLSVSVSVSVSLSLSLYIYIYIYNISICLPCSCFREALNKRGYIIVWVRVFLFVCLIPNEIQAIHII